MNQSLFLNSLYFFPYGLIQYSSLLLIWTQCITHRFDRSYNLIPTQTTTRTNMIGGLVRFGTKFGLLAPYWINVQIG